MIAILLMLQDRPRLISDYCSAKQALSQASYDACLILDAQGFIALFWAVDRRNMKTAPNFPWIVTDDPLPLVRKLLETGAEPNHEINATPKALMREGKPRIVFATALMRGAFSSDIELVRLLLEFDTDPLVRSTVDMDPREATPAAIARARARVFLKRVIR